MPSDSAFQRESAERQLRISDAAMRIIGTIASYAVENLDLLIVGENKQIIWPEANDVLQELAVRKGRPADLEMMYDTLEELAEVARYDVLDDIIKRLPNDLQGTIFKGAVIMGKATGRAGLKGSPWWIDELHVNGERILMTALLKTPKAAAAYNILRKRPKLLRFVTNYVLIQLGVEPISEPLAGQGAPPNVV